MVACIACGYMCGYATIALGRFAVDYGLVKGVSPETVVKIQCPCGLVTTSVHYDNGKTGATTFQSVPCFVFATDVKVHVGTCKSHTSTNQYKHSELSMSSVILKIVTSML